MSLFPAYATPNDDALASTTKEDTKTGRIIIFCFP